VRLAGRYRPPRREAERARQRRLSRSTALLAFPAVERTDWTPERSADAVRRRPLRFIASPWRDRAFLHERYEKLLQALADASRFHVVPLRELRGASSDRVIVGLRHDVDDRLQSALDLARLEHEHGLRATYFILHTAPYYGRLAWQRANHDETLVQSLRELQDLGHEVGWHNDLVTLQCVYDLEPRTYLAGELAWLRGEGVDVVGCASHGSYWCHALGFDNRYFFTDFADVKPGFPNKDVVHMSGRRIELAKGSLAEFGFEYDTGSLDTDRYFSDGMFGSDGRRWHPGELELDRLEPGEKLVLSIHPNYWDRSLGAKVAHTLTRGVNRLTTGRRA
jgi:hypothetical protein